MYSFLNPNGNKLVVVKVKILVILLEHVVILGYNFIETLKCICSKIFNLNFKVAFLITKEKIVPSKTNENLVKNLIDTRSSADKNRLKLNTFRFHENYNSQRK